MAIKRLTDLERFHQSYVEDRNGCWIWQKFVDRDGYGACFKIGSRTDGSRKGVRPHRWIYERTIGPIPAGYTIDHCCNVRNCVNPEHLEAVTSAENTKRGWRPHKLFCVNGHMLFGDNVWFDPNGHRQCAICTRDRQKRHYLKTNGAAQKRFDAKRKELRRLKSA